MGLLLSTPTGLVKYYVKIWDFWGGGFENNKRPFLAHSTPHTAILLGICLCKLVGCAMHMVVLFGTCNSQCFNAPGAGRSPIGV